MLKYVIVLAVWWVVFNYLLKNPLLQYSLERMPQEKPTQAVLMQILAELGDKNGMGLVMALQKHFRSDKEAITTVIVLAFVSAINTLDKMYWREPRPYFIQKMSPLNCKDLEHGNPSGHAMVTTAIYLTVF